MFLMYKCRVFQTQCLLQLGRIAFELLQFHSLQRWKPGNQVTSCPCWRTGGCLRQTLNKSQNIKLFLELKRCLLLKMLLLFFSPAKSFSATYSLQ